MFWVEINSLRVLLCLSALHLGCELFPVAGQELPRPSPSHADGSSSPSPVLMLLAPSPSQNALRDLHSTHQYQGQGDQTAFPFLPGHTTTLAGCLCPENMNKQYYYLSPAEMHTDPLLTRTFSDYADVTTRGHSHTEHIIIGVSWN